MYEQTMRGSVLSEREAHEGPATETSGLCATSWIEARAKLDTAADQAHEYGRRVDQLVAAGDRCSWQSVRHLLDSSHQHTKRDQRQRPTLLSAWRCGWGNRWRRSTRADGVDAIRQSLRRQRLGRAQLRLWRQQRPDIPR